MTLRIEVRAGAHPPTIELHGWLSLAEVAEFEKTVAEVGLSVSVDLEHLAGVDADGRQSLCRLRRSGVPLKGGSPYVELLLQQPEAGDSQRSRS